MAYRVDTSILDQPHTFRNRTALLVIDHQRRTVTLDRELPSGAVPSDVWDSSPDSRQDCIRVASNVSKAAYRDVLARADLGALYAALDTGQRAEAYGALNATLCSQGSAWRTYRRTTPR